MRNLRFAVVAASTVTVIYCLLILSRPRVIEVASISLPPTGGIITTDARFEDKASVVQTSSDIRRVANATLGFGKIMVIGLPERSDKRDAMALMASLSDMSVEWISGVKSSSIPDTAVPFGFDRTKLKETYLGSWRGHMNAIRRYVSIVDVLFIGKPHLPIRHPPLHAHTHHSIAIIK
jgi:hypothetical protein